MLETSKVREVMTLILRSTFWIFEGRFPKMGLMAEGGPNVGESLRKVVFVSYHGTCFPPCGTFLYRLLIELPYDNFLHKFLHNLCAALPKVRFFISKN